MLAILLLLAGQVLVTVFGLGLMWRRLDKVSSELAHVRGLLETLQARRFSATPQRARPAPAFAASAHDTDAWTGPPSQRSARTPAPRASDRLLMANDAPEDMASPSGALTPELVRLIAACAALALPAILFALPAPSGAVASAGLIVAAVLIATSLRPLWSAASWASVLGAGAWASASLVNGAADAAPFAFCAAATAASMAGLVHARLRLLTAGAAMALLLGAALLTLGARMGMAGPAGAAFGALVATAALVGASSLRVEALHVGALAAGGVGLFVLSGQEGAAVWFTPAIAWFGALFLAISLVRTPALGARGLMLAATGAIAPLLAAASLFASEHALASPRAAAAAFACLAAIFAALLAAAAQRNGRGVSGLRLTAWALASAVLAALSAAAYLALPAPLAAPALAAAALGVIALDRRMPDRVWRAAAIAAIALAAIAAGRSVNSDWPPLPLIGAAIVAPALLAGLAAQIAQRTATFTASLLELFAISGGIVAMTLLLRFALNDGAMDAPLGYVEAGAHIAAFLAAALALAARADHGARNVRRWASAVLSLAACVAALVAALLWLTPWWSDRPGSGLSSPLFQHQPLGFALPAMLAWAHWTFWRARGAHTRTRIAMAAATLLTACFAFLELIGARDGAAAPGMLDPLIVAGGVLAFACAIGANFAPGVTAEPSLYFEKYFQRDRRSQQRV